MKHLITYTLFEKVESKIPIEDFLQIKEILANSFEGSPISFDVDDIREVDRISSLLVHKDKNIFIQHGYMAIQISMSFLIPIAQGWIHDKKYIQLNKDMKPYIDKFESFLNDYGYSLRREPGKIMNRYYNFEFFVSLHLSSYNESISDLTDLKEIEELFYPISDDHYFNILVRKDRARYIRFDKPIVYVRNKSLGKSVYKFKNISNISDDLNDSPFHPVIRVLITKSEIGPSLNNKPTNRMDLNTFVDDLKFPIDYIEKEKGLKLRQIWVSGFFYGSDYPSYLYYRDLDALMSDDIMNKSMLSLVLYFGDY